MTRDGDSFMRAAMSTTPTPTPMMADQGKAAALTVYILYLLTIPSGGMTTLIGMVVAYLTSHGAAGVWRTHLRSQMRAGALWFVWGVGIFVVLILGTVLKLILIGFVIVWVAGLAYLALLIWFTVKSVLGLIAMLENRVPA